MPDDRLRRTLRWIGAIVAIACAAWITNRFVEHDVARALAQAGGARDTTLRAMAATALYFPALCLQGLAWWCVQASLSDTDPPLRRLFSIYATTQFAKYLPGNVGHFVGRHYLARSEGASDAVLLAGAVAEVGLLLAAAAVWAGPALNAMAPASFHWLPHGRHWHFVIAFAAAFAIAIMAMRNIPRIRRLAPLRRPTWLVSAWAMHLIFFGGMALCLASSMPAIAADVPLSAVATAAATSWIAGFIVIGAPAGVGVRETVLVLMLREHMPESEALAAALTFRMATFSGDFLLFLTGCIMGARNVKPAA